MIDTLAGAVQNVTVDEGQDALLPCNIPQNQKTLFAIQWHKNTSKYITKKYFPLSTYKNTERDVSFGSKDSLIIRSTTIDDADVYRCKALYVDSSNVAVTVRLFVRGKNSVEMYLYIARDVAPLGNLI